jgi:aminopeptidase-like protein
LADGHQLHELASRLFPIARSLTGNGVRKSLNILNELLDDLVIHEVASGTPAFDWIVPNEWNLRRAQLIGPNGHVIVDSDNHNLHVVGYSVPTTMSLTLYELQPHLHSLPDQPNAIPYVTSYYKRDWGFCLTHNQRESLTPGNYTVKIDADLQPGSLTYADLVIPGHSPEEILISTYICHPSMANNELSGPVVATYLAQWIKSQPREYTYRFVFLPETIGALVYLSRHLKHLQTFVKAGFVVTCCGNPGTFSYMPSRTGTTYADELAKTVLQRHAPDFKEYSFLQRGSDERQYCAPLIDLPVASVMRSKYHEYPEYHTSFDDLSFITAAALERTLDIYVEILLAAESNCVPLATQYGEPHLSKYGLYPTLGGQIDQRDISMTTDVLALADGRNSLLQISQITNLDIVALRLRVDELCDKGLLTLVPHQS